MANYRDGIAPERDSFKKVSSLENHNQAEKEIIEHPPDRSGVFDLSNRARHFTS